MTEEFVDILEKALRGKRPSFIRHDEATNTDYCVHDSRIDTDNIVEVKQEKKDYFIPIIDMEEIWKIQKMKSS